MPDKRELIVSLRDILARWEALLISISEEEIVARRFSKGWSIKDMIVHLMAWQKISVARLEAALFEKDPLLPAWLDGNDPFYAEAHTDVFNAQIYELHHRDPWQIVCQAWKEGFQRFLDLAEVLDERNLQDPERYPWLDGYALSAVLNGSYEHHQEHYGDIEARLNRSEEPSIG